MLNNMPRTASTKAVVSYWHVPGGYMYDCAQVVELFFDCRDTAEKYAAKYDAPPEMATATSIEYFDFIIAKCAKNYKEYKKRYLSCFDS